MGFVLQPKNSSELEDLYVNAWNWRPTLEILRQENVLDEETLELVSYQFDHTITAEQARKIANFLDSYLTKLPPEHRILYDGTIVADDPDRAQHSDETTWAYSTTDSWLSEFRDFCRQCDGFSVG